MVDQMRTDSETQARTIAEIAARCDGPNQFDSFDSMFRHALTIPKAAVIKEETRRKRLRVKKPTA
jgi:hypothetical protein